MLYSLKYTDRIPHSFFLVGGGEGGLGANSKGALIRAFTVSVRLGEGFALREL